MAMEPVKAAQGLTQAGLRAWGNALVKTGTQHLDLGMVRQGKATLKEAEATPAVTPAPSETIAAPILGSSPDLSRALDLLNAQLKAGHEREAQQTAELAAARRELVDACVARLVAEEASRRLADRIAQIEVPRSLWRRLYARWSTASS